MEAGREVGGKTGWEEKRNQRPESTQEMKQPLSQSSELEINSKELSRRNEQKVGF